MSFFWQNPSGNDWNYYLNFLLYAVLGKTSQADALMRRHGKEVRQVAQHLRARLLVPKRPLYRGVLVEPELVVGGKLAADPHLTFVSWSESLEVACWFADPQSIMSEFVRSQRKRAEGFILKASKAPAPVLFHYQWTRNFDLAKLALMHPDLEGQRGYEQIRWALASQQEVITENVSVALPATPVEDLDCPPTEELDTQLAWPGAL